MKEEQRKFRLPVWPVILDVFGTLFVVLGILALVGGEKFFIPGLPDMRPFAIVLIVAGVLLMLPLVVIFISQAKSPE